jgi:micrococcal nuclease
VAAVAIAALARGGGDSTAPSNFVLPTATGRPTFGPIATAGITPPAIRPDPALLQRAQVVRVIDGDTIVVEMAGEEEHVRYYGIDTTERGEACYEEAKERNRQLARATVLLLPDARDRDRSGRLLRYVFDADGASIDAELIAEGLAYAWREDGAYRDVLIGAEEAARFANAGCLWSRAAP